MSYSCPGRQAARFALRGDRTLILLVFAEDGAEGEQEEFPAEDDLTAQRREIHGRFDDAGWECPQIMAAMDTCESLYLDRVSQIRMDSWSSGRVALIGDAAACPSLLAGQGSAFAMIAAYVLAGELKGARGNHRAAFASYERVLRRFIESKQEAAERFASSFAPRTRLGIFLRNVITKAMGVPLITHLAIGRSLRDDLILPDYAVPIPPNRI